MLSTLFGIDEPLGATTPTRTTTASPTGWPSASYRPRALFERFNIEVIATTEGALDDLTWHKMIRDSGWKGRVVTAYRPDAVVDPDFEGFAANLDRLGEITGSDTGTWAGYLEAHRKRRAFFKSLRRDRRPTTATRRPRRRTFRPRRRRRCSAACDGQGRSARERAVPRRRC